MADGQDPNVATAAGFAQGQGYRRRIRIVPAPGEVVAVLEDDIHCMAVRLRHDGEQVLGVEPVTDRMPWSTCPGSAQVLIDTFAGVPLQDVTTRKDRKRNCTHLHDMAVLAAAHAVDPRETRFAIAVSDPVRGRRELELRRNGMPVQRWVEQDGVLVSPAGVAGRTLLTLRDWIATLPADEAEEARLLQWAGLVAHGRTIPADQQVEAVSLPANCYTLQPERARSAHRNGKIVDFNLTDRVPGEALARQLGLGG